MNANKSFILAIGAAMALNVMPMAHGFAQESAAGQEMHQSGEAIKDAGSATADSIKHAAKGTAYKAGDAALTTKVKAKLLADEKTRPYSVSVDSDNGTVTLEGAVDSPAAAKYVETVVASVDGVQTVNNKLTWPNS